MPYELLATYLKLPVFGLVAARLAGLLMFQPVLGALSIPHPVRVLFVLALAALLTPLVSMPAAAPDSALGLLVALAGEMLTGIALGTVLIACFVGLQLGGLLLAQETGVAFGQIVDPTSEEQETVFGVFYLQLAAVVYLVLGGHRALVAACLDTFRTLPLLSVGPDRIPGVDLLCAAFGLSCEVALRVAGPVLLALFLVNVALGFVSRTMPQLNILAIGFSAKALVAFLLMAVSLPTATGAFIDAVDEIGDWMRALTGGVP